MEKGQEESRFLGVRILFVYFIHICQHTYDPSMYQVLTCLIKTFLIVYWGVKWEERERFCPLSRFILIFVQFPFLLMELVLSRLFVIYFGCFLPRHVYKCVIWCGCHSLKHEISVNKKPPPHQLEHLKPLDMKTASCWTVGHVERRLQKTI